MSKILFLVTQSEFGGAQRYVYEIARSLNKKNYDILVTAGEGDGELFRKCQMVNVKCQKLTQLKRTPWPWQIALAILEIRNLLKQEKTDVLFLCSTTAGILGSLAAFMYRGRTSKNLKHVEVRPQVIYRIGGWAFKDPRAFWKNWLILWAEKISSSLKDIIIVNSEIDRKLALKYKIVPEKKLVKIYNGIDQNSLTFFSREQALLRFDLPRRSNLVVGTIANFYKTKGLEYLIEAFNLLRLNLLRLNLHWRFSLLIIGEGKLRPKLESLIEKYELQEKAILVGRIPDAYRYLKAFDVFVLPSLKEGFPWIILEAISAEIPIVATKVGAVPEVLDENFLVDPGNSHQLAKKISQMLEHPAKAKLKSEFTLQEMVSETEKLLS